MFDVHPFGAHAYVILALVVSAEAEYRNIISIFYNVARRVKTTSTFGSLVIIGH